jgi:DNA-binding transcriptional MerR regulator
MVSDSDTFDLGELSSAAGVTPRTIRYYVQQGLLPSPGTRGPGTRYDRAHLDRLHLIRRLQREHLPLAEIRRRLEALDDEGVRTALATTTDADPEGVARSSSALDYVRELLARQAARTEVARPPGQVPPPTLSASAARAGAPSAAFGVPAPQTSQGFSARQVTEPALSQSVRPTRSTWDRIPLASDVELHVRRPLSREQNRRVERLIETARGLFAEEP